MRWATSSRKTSNCSTRASRSTSRASPWRRAAGRLIKAGGAAQGANQDKTPEEKPAADLPDRFIAYLFDDVHMKFGDLAHSRDAAGRHIDSALRTTDRAAIYTTSGQTIQDFTDDRKLAARGAGQSAHAAGDRTGHQRSCPNMTYYMADLIENKHDRDRAGCGDAGCHVVHEPGSDAISPGAADGHSRPRSRN